MTVTIARRTVGPGRPCFIVSELGINHNGDMDIARRMIDAAADAGVDAVKFQTGNPRAYVRPERWSDLRDTPWGRMPYIDYRRALEFTPGEYEALAAHAGARGLAWLVSCLDAGTVEWMDDLAPAAYKVASPMLTDRDLLRAFRDTGRPVVLSTGMSTLPEIDRAVSRLDRSRLVVLHCTSAYPAPPEQINLRAMDTLRHRYDVPIGYSGHEVGLQTTVAAVARGACMVERHLTLSRAMWGSDQAASVEPQGWRRLVRDIRTVERALGDGVKRVYDSERENMRKFRRSETAGVGA